MILLRDITSRSMRTILSTSATSLLSRTAALRAPPSNHMKSAPLPLQVWTTPAARARRTKPRSARGRRTPRKTKSRRTSSISSRLRRSSLLSRRSCNTTKTGMCHPRMSRTQKTPKLSVNSRRPKSRGRSFMETMRMRERKVRRRMASPTQTDRQMRRNLFLPRKSYHRLPNATQQARPCALYLPQDLHLNVPNHDLHPNLPRMTLLTMSLLNGLSTTRPYPHDVPSPLLTI